MVINDDAESMAMPGMLSQRWLDINDDDRACNNDNSSAEVTFFRKHEMRTNKAVATMFVAGVSCWWRVRDR